MNRWEHVLTQFLEQHRSGGGGLTVAAQVVRVNVERKERAPVGVDPVQIMLDKMSLF